MSKTSRWEAQHAKGEKQLAKVLRSFWADQSKRVIAGLADAGYDTAAVATVLKIDEENELLLAKLSDPLLTFLSVGAQDIYRQVDNPKAAKAFDFERFNLPQRAIDAIETAFADLSAKDYWKEIQQGTIDLITSAITEAMKEGLGADAMAKRLRETFSGMSKVRSVAIARTETTGAYNSGHSLAYVELAESGFDIKQEWLSIIDNTTRQSHIDANGQIVGPAESFTIGGSSARYPGDAALPAKERVHCRCTTAIVV